MRFIIVQDSYDAEIELIGLLFPNRLLIAPDFCVFAEKNDLTVILQKSKVADDLIALGLCTSSFMIHGYFGANFEASALEKGFSVCSQQSDDRESTFYGITSPFGLKIIVIAKSELQSLIFVPPSKKDENCVRCFLSRLPLLFQQDATNAHSGSKHVKVLEAEKQSMEHATKRRNYISSLPPPPAMQSLQLSVFHQNEDRIAVANTRMPIRFETDLFEGACLVLLRTSPMDSFYRHIFEGKKRMCEVQVQGRFKQAVDPQTILVGFEISHMMGLGLVTRSLCSGILRFLRSFQSRLHHSFGDPDDEELPHMVMPWYNGVERMIVTPLGEVPPPLGISFQESLSSVDRRRKTDPASLVDFINTTSVYSFSLHTQFIDMCEWDLLNLPMISRMDLKTFWQDSYLRMVVYSTAKEIILNPNSRHLTRDNKYMFLLKLKHLEDFEMDSESNLRLEKGMVMFSGKAFANNTELLRDEVEKVEADMATINNNVAPFAFDSLCEFEDEMPWWKYPHQFSFSYYPDAAYEMLTMPPSAASNRARAIRFRTTDDSDVYEDAVIGMKQAHPDSREDLASLDLRIAMDMAGHRSDGSQSHEGVSVDSDESSGDDFRTVIGSLEKIMDDEDEDDDDDAEASFDETQLSTPTSGSKSAAGNTSGKKEKLLSRLVTRLKAANVERKRVKQVKREKKLQDREIKRKLKEDRRAEKGRLSILGLRRSSASGSMHAKDDDAASNNSDDYYDARSDNDDDESESKNSPAISASQPDIGSIAHFSPPEEVGPPCLRQVDAKSIFAGKVTLNDLMSDIHSKLGEIHELGLGKEGKEWFFQNSHDAISFLVDNDLSYTAACIDIIDCRYGKQESAQEGAQTDRQTATKRRREVYLIPIPQSYQKASETSEDSIKRPFRKKFVLRSYSEFCTSLPFLAFSDLPDEKRITQEEKRRRSLAMTMKILYCLSSRDKSYADFLQSRLLFSAVTEVEETFMHLRGPPCLVLSPAPPTGDSTSPKTAEKVSAVRSFNLPDIPRCHPVNDLIGLRSDVKTDVGKNVVYFESTVCVALDRRRWSEHRMFISSEKKKLVVCKTSGEVNDKDCQASCLFSIDISEEILGFRPLFSHEMPFEGVWMFQVSTFAKVFCFFVLTNQELLWWMVALHDCVCQCHPEFINMESNDPNQFVLADIVARPDSFENEDDFEFVSRFHLSNLHIQVPALSDPTRVLAKPDSRVLASRRVLNFRRILFRTPYRLLSWAKPLTSGPAVVRFTAKLAQLSSQLREENLDTWLRFMDDVCILQTLNLQLIPVQLRLLACFNIIHATYNHAYNVVIPPSTWSGWPSYFNNMSIMVGNDIVSLSEFEHCVIRKGMSKPSTLFGRISVPQSSFLFSCPLHDFRTNLVLNCGCTSLSQHAYAFTAGDFDQEMDDACRRCIQETVYVDVESKTVTIPKSCDWFEDDFAGLIVPEPSPTRVDSTSDAKSTPQRKESIYTSSKQGCIRRMFPYLSARQKQDLLAISSSKLSNVVSSKKLAPQLQGLPAANDGYWDALKIEYGSYSFRIRPGGVSFYQTIT